MKTLSTLLCEVETQVTNRLLTKVSDDPNDAAALTPSHLLLLRGNPNYPLGKSLINYVYRTRWRQVQYLADLFWRQWIRKYMPQLQVRTKWLLSH